MKRQPQAIKSDVFSDFRKILTKKESRGKPVQDVEERQLYDLAVSDGWALLKEYINNLKTDVEAINHNVMQSGAAFEDIGRNAVVIQLTKDLLNKVVQKVEDARESQEPTSK